MLYLLLKHGEKAIDIVINLWYSTSLTPAQKILVAKEMSDIFKDFGPGQFPKSKQFDFGSIQLVAQFGRQVWMSIAKMVGTPMTLQELVQSRNQIMLHPARRDHRDRYMNRLLPAERLARDYFRHHGLLLPYGSFNAHLNVPNTLFLDPDFGWTLTDSVDRRLGSPSSPSLRSEIPGIKQRSLRGCLLSLA